MHRNTGSKRHGKYGLYGRLCRGIAGIMLLTGSFVGFERQPNQNHVQELRSL